MPGHAARALILTRLWARMPCPVQILVLGETVDAGTVPAVAAFEVTDSAFAAGSPFDGAAEGSSMFLSTSGLRRFAFAGDDHVLDAQLGELLVDLGFAVAAVGGDAAWRAPGAFDDPLHRRGQLRRIGRIALLHRVIQHDPVVIVDDLGLLPELDRLTEPALGDRAGITVVQADPPTRPIGGVAVHPLAGLRDDLPRRGSAVWPGR